jgi:hypothetical protein
MIPQSRTPSSLQRFALALACIALFTCVCNTRATTLHPAIESATLDLFSVTSITVRDHKGFIYLTAGF